MIVCTLVCFVSFQLWWVRPAPFDTVVRAMTAPTPIRDKGEKGNAEVNDGLSLGHLECAVVMTLCCELLVPSPTVFVADASSHAASENP